MINRSLGHVNRRSALAGSALALTSSAVSDAASAQDETLYDVVVIGGGTAGLPAATFAAQRGARVLIIEASAQLGGTLFLSGARMSAAGTKLQKERGIDDNPDLHFEDVMRMSKQKANAEIVRLAVDNAGATFDWLRDNGLPVVDGTPTARGSAHEAQSRARYVWAPKAGLDVLAVLEKMIAPHIKSGQITLRTSTEVTALRQAADGKISHVIAKGEDGRELTFRGRHVVLSSGGYTSNSAMFEALEGAPDYASGTYPYSQGIGITLGRSVGGYVRGGEHHIPSFGAILAGEEIPSPVRAYLNSNPLKPEPREIWVDAHGARFVKEDTLDIHEKELALTKLPNERFWAVFDDKALQSDQPIVRGLSSQDLIELCDSDPMFAKADTIEQLAAKAGIDAAKLQATVNTYNASQRSGRDSLGRTFMPSPIQQAPFYAVRVQSYQIISFAGLAVDKRLRVLRVDGTPVPNLYAAGEVLGAGQLMGQNYFGGMLVTPALTFGRLLGHTLIDLKA